MANYYTEEESKDFHSPENDWVEIFDALGIPKTVDYLHNKPDAERWLCVCRGGNTRSAAAAFLLKYKYMKDALAMSLEKNSPSTQLYLIQWAEKILVTEKDHYTALRPLVQNASIFLLDLSVTERLRARPYEISFLKEVDKKLKELL